MAATAFKLDTREFRQTLDLYGKFSKRDRAVIVNTKAFYIARRAVVETIKADKKNIRAFIRAKSGAIVGRLINKRRGARGEKGLYGDAMAEAVIAVLANRLRSVAFLKSGWLRAIKTLEPLAERIRGNSVPRKDSTVKEYGKAKGDARPAREGAIITMATIRNLAIAKHDKHDALGKFGGPALQRAIDFETRSMNDYIERKLRDAANEAGIKTN